MADVVSTVGSNSRQYATWALWIASVPANLVTSGNNNYQGDGYQDTEFTGTNTLLSISGFTTDATHQIIATASTNGGGQSFQDNASVRTNALKYNASNGVGLKNTASYGNTVITINNAYVQITRLQLSCTQAHTLVFTATGANCNNVILKDCILNAVEGSLWDMYGSGNIAENLAGFLSGTSGNGFRLQNGSKGIGCTVVRDSGLTPSGTGATSRYGSNTIQSCAVFGFATAADSVAWDTTNSKNNATDKASGFPGSTGNQYSVTYNSTTPFTNATVASLDLRAIASTSLAANGYKDGTNAPNDISGYARAASPTIGAWEITAAGGATALKQYGLLNGLGASGPFFSNPLG